VVSVPRSARWDLPRRATGDKSAMFSRLEIRACYVMDLHPRIQLPFGAMVFGDDFRMRLNEFRIFDPEKNLQTCKGRDRATERKLAKQKPQTDLQRLLYRERQRRSRATRYSWRDVHGACLDCGQPRSERSKSRCDVCLARNAESSLRSWRRRKLRKALAAVDPYADSTGTPTTRD